MVTTIKNNEHIQLPASEERSRQVRNYHDTEYNRAYSLIEKHFSSQLSEGTVRKDMGQYDQYL